MVDNSEVALAFRSGSYMNPNCFGRNDALGVDEEERHSGRFAPVGKTNTGVLRCAQNDDVKATATATATAKATAKVTAKSNGQLFGWEKVLVARPLVLHWLQRPMPIGSCIRRASRLRRLPRL
jgi:hypothetical protein